MHRREQRRHRPAGGEHATPLTAPVPDISLGYSGLPIITSSITIEGNNSTVRRESGAPDFRVFTVGRLGQLTLNNTTVSGGKLQRFSGGRDFLYSGGGLLSYEGITVLTNCTVTGNVAGEDGGGIASLGGVLRLTNSTVSSNTAYEASGGMRRELLLLIITLTSGCTAAPSVATTRARAAVGSRRAAAPLSSRIA